MTDEELIAWLRDLAVVLGKEAFTCAADRIEALVKEMASGSFYKESDIDALQDRIKRLESVGRAYREVTHHLKPCPETSAAFDAALGNKP